MEVRIAQPSDDVIEITSVGKRYTLTKSAGDFSCDASGLRLKERSSSMLWLISNIVRYESRTFNRAQDGSLIMKSEYHAVGNHTLFPVDTRGEGGARWAASSRAPQ
jgi:hypothetical protein